MTGGWGLSGFGANFGHWVPRMPRRFSDVARFGPLGPVRMEGGTPRRTGTMLGWGLKDWERASVRAFSCGEGGLCSKILIPEPILEQGPSFAPKLLAAPNNANLTKPFVRWLEGDFAPADSACRRLTSGYRRGVSWPLRFAIFPTSGLSIKVLWLLCDTMPPLLE